MDITRGWRVVPPCIAIHQQSERWLGVVCGARSVRLLNQLNKSLPASVEIHSGKGYPDQILLTASSQELLLACAKDLGLLAQIDVPAALLLSLSPITHPSYRPHVSIPLGKGWKIERFSTSSLGWKVSSEEEAFKAKADLFHFSLGYRHQYLFCSNQEAYEVDVRIGKFLSLARRQRQVIRYQESSETFLVPASLRPPRLIERALTLSSGLPALFNVASGLLSYRNIPEKIAKYTAALLCQEMKK